MGRVALMDWDNTIRQGWTIRDWTLHLEGCGLVPAETLRDVDEVIDNYAAKQCTYTEMANTVLRALASGLKGQSAAVVADQAPSFIKGDRGNFYPFAAEALRELRARGLSLVVVSGAPEEVLDAAAEEYGFAKVRGSVLDVSEGRYVGTVKKNRAVVEGKQAALGSLLGEQVAALAIGDSEADLPLLERARLKIVVGDRELAARVPGSLFIEPLDPDISPLLNAVDTA
ncbi:MAG TPA: HAD-IB family phosphatase [Solirubrobacterales bacterium]|nr:HAD-IB family phosphatase [Solirubrobacterales bacterium]